MPFRGRILTIRRGSAFLFPDWHDMNLQQADIQLSAAKYLRWLVGHCVLGSEEICIEGWALGVWDVHEEFRFLVNGQDFDHVEWPLPSPDLLGPFPDVPDVATSRFRCRHRIRAGESLFPDGFVRFNVTSRYGEHRLSYRHAWYVADPQREPLLPTPEQVARVIGTPDLPAFCMGGATIVRRFDQLLTERFGRPLTSFRSILDWGCGAGRMSRYLPQGGPVLTGIDIDPDNIETCRRTLPFARFHHVELLPPTPFADGSFDLVFGLSVLTHLDEPVQDAWLAELQRITAPGGLALLSVQGLAQMSLYRAPPALKLEAHRRGILDTGGNAQLNEVIADQTYYRDVLHSPDYIFTHWERYFEVLDIIESIAGNQDLVLLRRRDS